MCYANSYEVMVCSIDELLSQLMLGGPNCETERSTPHATALFLAMTYIPRSKVSYDYGSTGTAVTDMTIRDTYRINRCIDMHAHCSSFVSVTNASAHWTYNTESYLNADFSNYKFYSQLKTHLKHYNKSLCLSTIILDYFWMPPLWAKERYLGVNFHLIKFLTQIATNEGVDDLRMDHSSCIYLPLAPGINEAISGSETFGELKQVLSVTYLTVNEYDQHPLVRSDLKWAPDIEKIGKKSVACNLQLLGDAGYSTSLRKEPKFLKLTKKLHCHFKRWR